MTQIPHIETQDGKLPCICLDCAKQRVVDAGPAFPEESVVHVKGFDSPTSTGRVVDVQKPTDEPGTLYEWRYVCSFADGEVAEFGESELREATEDDWQALDAFLRAQAHTAEHEQETADDVPAWNSPFYDDVDKYQFTSEQEDERLYSAIQITEIADPFAARLCDHCDTWIATTMHKLGGHEFAVCDKPGHQDAIDALLVERVQAEQAVGKD